MQEDERSDSRWLAAFSRPHPPLCDPVEVGRVDETEGDELAQPRLVSRPGSLARPSRVEPVAALRAEKRSRPVRHLIQLVSELRREPERGKSRTGDSTSPPPQTSLSCPAALLRLTRRLPHRDDLCGEESGVSAGCFGGSKRGRRALGRRGVNGDSVVKLRLRGCGCGTGSSNRKRSGGVDRTGKERWQERERGRIKREVEMGEEVGSAHGYARQPPCAVAEASARDAPPILIATAKPWSISSLPRPMRCSPTTFSSGPAQIIFIAVGSFWSASIIE